MDRPVFLYHSSHTSTCYSFLNHATRGLELVGKCCGLATWRSKSCSRDPLRQSSANQISTSTSWDHSSQCFLKHQHITDKTRLLCNFIISTPSNDATTRPTRRRLFSAASVITQLFQRYLQGLQLARWGTDYLQLCKGIATKVSRLFLHLAFLSTTHT